MGLFCFLNFNEFVKFVGGFINNSIIYFGVSINYTLECSLSLEKVILFNVNVSKENKTFCKPELMRRAFLSKGKYLCFCFVIASFVEVYFDNLIFGKLSEPFLTSVDGQIELMSSKSIDMLVTALNGKKSQVSVTYIPPSLFLGGTT